MFHTFAVCFLGWILRVCCPSRDRQTKRRAKENVGFGLADGRQEALRRLDASGVPARRQNSERPQRRLNATAGHFRLGALWENAHPTPHPPVWRRVCRCISAKAKETSPRGEAVAVAASGRFRSHLFCFKGRARRRALFLQKKDEKRKGVERLQRLGAVPVAAWRESISFVHGDGAEVACASAAQGSNGAFNLNDRKKPRDCLD